MPLPSLIFSVRDHHQISVSPSTKSSESDRCSSHMTTWFSLSAAIWSIIVVCLSLLYFIFFISSNMFPPFVNSHLFVLLVFYLLVFRSCSSSSLFVSLSLFDLYFVFSLCFFFFFSLFLSLSLSTSTLTATCNHATTHRHAKNI